MVPANTDFFDSLNLDGITVEKAWVNIGDDCFSPKANTSNIHVNYIYCNGRLDTPPPPPPPPLPRWWPQLIGESHPGTHGQSMGSIGQYSGEKDIIENVLIENAWMLNGQFGGRLKTWAGEDVGYGLINNVSFKNVWSANTQYSAYLDSCYFNVTLPRSPIQQSIKCRMISTVQYTNGVQINASECAAYPSAVNISNISFENFSGYTSGKYGRAVARLTCSSSPSAVCENISFKNFTVTSPCGNGTDDAVIICDGITDLGVPCVNSTSAEAIAALADTCSVGLATLPEKPW